MKKNDVGDQPMKSNRRVSVYDVIVTDANGQSNAQREQTK